MLDIEKYKDEQGVFDRRYKLLRLLSKEGGTADVWLAEDIGTRDTTFDGDELISVEGTGNKVALKIYRPKNMLDAEGIELFKKEFNTVYGFRHTNLLIPDYLFFIDDSIPYLVMPYCETGSAEYLMGKMQDKDALWKFIGDTAAGLAYLHSYHSPVIHQDIKPGNILIDQRGNYCITDFGISEKTGDANGGNSNGTIQYMPPERFKEGYIPRPESDIWSLGATIFEMVTGKLPYGDDGGYGQKGKMRPDEIKVDVPKKIKELICACLDPDPDKRPTAEAIVKLARNRDRPYVLINTVAFVIVVCVVGGAVALGRGEAPNAFTKLCNSGDSIIRIEKDDAKQTALVSDSITRLRLNKAVDFYKKALQESDYDFARRDCVERRIETINELPQLFDSYKIVSDSLIKAIDLELEFQIDRLKKVQVQMSDKIKNKIISL